MTEIKFIPTNPITMIGKDGKYIISYTTILGDQVEKEFDTHEEAVGFIEALETK